MTYPQILWINLLGDNMLVRIVVKTNAGIEDLVFNLNKFECLENLGRTDSVTLYIEGGSFQFGFKDTNTANFFYERLLKTIAENEETNTDDLKIVKLN